MSARGPRGVHGGHISMTDQLVCRRCLSRRLWFLTFLWFDCFPNRKTCFCAILKLSSLCVLIPRLTQKCLGLYIHRQAWLNEVGNENQFRFKPNKQGSLLFKGFRCAEKELQNWNFRTFPSNRCSEMTSGTEKMAFGPASLA